MVKVLPSSRMSLVTIPNMATDSTQKNISTCPGTTANFVLCLSGLVFSFLELREFRPHVAGLLQGLSTHLCHETNSVIVIALSLNMLTNIFSPYLFCNFLYCYCRASNKWYSAFTQVSCASVRKYFARPLFEVGAFY